MKIKYFSGIIAALLALSGQGNGGPTMTAPLEQSAYADKVNLDWMDNDYWYDGKAEVNLYQASIIKYGKAREADQVVHILVTEKHQPDKLVKADNWQAPGLVDMLKFNYLTAVPTGIYTYREMMSVFFEQRNLQVAKMSFSSQEWCGNSFKELVHFRGESSYRFNTYWDGEGEGSFAVDFPSDLVMYDALPVQLRMLDLGSKRELNIQMLPTQISSKVKKPMPQPARVKIGGEQRITVPGGTFSAIQIQVTHSGGLDEFWFEKSYPHRMLRWRAFNGNSYELLKSSKLAYWQLNRPGDEKYLP